MGWIILGICILIFLYRLYLFLSDFFNSYSEVVKLRNQLKVEQNSHQQETLKLRDELRKERINIEEMKRTVRQKEDLLSIYKRDRDKLCKLEELQEHFDEIQEKADLYDELKSNITAIPYLSSMIADYQTYGLEILAKQLDWGYAYERMKKVDSIREIRKNAQKMVEENLEAKYQLNYLLNLFPNLQDVLDTDYNTLPKILKPEDLAEHDGVRDYLSREEYQQLSVAERNQLALDRYFTSHNKTKWQIGRDYEMYIGYMYQQKGYTVDYFGSYKGLEDLGRDLIVKKGNKTLIVQCKYWSKEKQIHEKHITQLYGTMASYIVENGLSKKDVSAVLVTNIQLSEQAKKMADYLKVKYLENAEKKRYPCIKCNIGRSEYGATKIYHLPFDLNYDSTKIDAEGEFFAMTVQEAESKGFRRAYKWFGNQ